MAVSYADVEPGTEIPPQSYRVTRLDLVKYAGASGDFNVIHWNERLARSVGLPTVIAHGMYTMAQAGRYVSDWAGDPGAITDFSVRFSAMVPVPDDDQGATIEVSGKVAEKLAGNQVAIDMTARFFAGTGQPGFPAGTGQPADGTPAQGTKVLTRARAVVRLP